MEPSDWSQNRGVSDESTITATHLFTRDSTVFLFLPTVLCPFLLLVLPHSFLPQQPDGGIAFIILEFCVATMEGNGNGYESD
jgi:hypothetical protein